MHKSLLHKLPQKGQVKQQPAWGVLTKGKGNFLSSTLVRILFRDFQLINITFINLLIDKEKVETVADFILLGSKITAEGDSSH